MDESHETQYIVYEDYLVNESIKTSPSTNHSSIPTLYVNANQNIHHNFKTETSLISKNILGNLTSPDGTNDSEQKIIDQCQILPISYEVKNADVLQSAAEVPVSANIGSKAIIYEPCQTVISSVPNYQINLPPLACTSFLDTDSVEPPSGSSDSIEKTVQISVLNRNVENSKASEFDDVVNADLITSGSMQGKHTKLKKINPECFVKLLQDDLLKFGTSVVRVIDGLGDETHHSIQIVEKGNQDKSITIKNDYNSFISTLVDRIDDEINKITLLHCTHCDLPFSSPEKLTNHENNECLGNLSCINILNSQTNHPTCNKNIETFIADKTLNSSTKYSKDHSSCYKCNCDKKNTNFKAEFKPIWKCLVCLKDCSTLYNLENHYNTHSIQDLAKALVKYTEPHYSYGQVTNITDNEESHNTSGKVNKNKNNFLSDVSTINTVSSNLDNPPNILKQSTDKNNSNYLASMDCSDQLLLGTKITKNAANLKCDNTIKPKTYNTQIRRKRVKSNFDTNKFGSKELPPNDKESLKSPTILKLASSKMVKRIKGSRSIGSGPSSRDPHQCSVCKKILSSRGNLAKHLIQHQSTKPWTCDSCDSSFNSKRDCDQHHMQWHTNIRPFVCQICSKGYITKKTLDEHMSFHAAKKSYICKLCGKTFLTNKCVKRHMRRHETVKKFNCGVCYKLFRVKEDLFTHIRKVHLTKKKPNDDKCKFSSTSVPFCASDLSIPLQKRKKKSGTKAEIVNKYDSLQELGANGAQQNDLMKEVAEFFIPTASAAVIFPELCELSSNVRIGKDEFFTNGENYVPISTLIPVSTQVETNKGFFNALSNKSRVNSESSTYIMLGLTEKQTGTTSSSHVLNCSSDLPMIYNQEFSELQHIKTNQPNIGQIFSSNQPVEASNQESFSCESDQIIKGGGRNSEEVTGEKQKAELILSSHPPLIDPPHISLEMISQSLQFEFQESHEVNNQNSMF